jgi:hypothetical protein
LGVAQSCSEERKNTLYSGAIQIYRIVIAKAKPEAIRTLLPDCFAASGSQ